MIGKAMQEKEKILPVFRSFLNYFYIISYKMVIEKKSVAKVDILNEKE
jgi:hypothetical protein